MNENTSFNVLMKGIDGRIELNGIFDCLNLFASMWPSWKPGRALPNEQCSFLQNCERVGIHRRGSRDVNPFVCETVRERKSTIFSHGFTFRENISCWRWFSVTPSFDSLSMHQGSRSPLPLLYYANKALSFTWPTPFCPLPCLLCFYSSILFFFPHHSSSGLLRCCVYNYW